MNKDIFKLKPQNLPVYTYQLNASVAFVFNREVYALCAYSFAKIKIAVNQPLRAGDVLDNSCCYYGNENTELIPHLQKSRVLCGAEEELRYYCGCRIDRLALSYVGEYSRSCGDGKCTVFVEFLANQAFPGCRTFLSNSAGSGSGSNGITDVKPLINQNFVFLR